MAPAFDRQHMLRTIELAEKGRGLTRPNPLVGAVIVKSNRIIAEGYHRGAGKPHAERVALKKAGNRARGATLYVNLEPCCHTGRTSPCTDAITAAGIKRVVFAHVDPDPRVAGKGARQLRKAGVEVTSGIGRSEAERLNDLYLGYYEIDRPYVILKLAQSLDGRISTSTGDSKWISSAAARSWVHRLRSEVDAVVIGAGTVRSDNPHLTVRSFKGINPYRIIVRGGGRIPKDSNLLKLNRDHLTILATSEPVKFGQSSNGTINWQLQKKKAGVDLHSLIASAKAFGIRSILVEGGAQLATSFLRESLVDKIVIVSAPLLIGGDGRGIDSLDIREVKDSIRLSGVRREEVGSDLITIGYPTREKG